MRNIALILLLLINLIRCFPHLIVFYLHPKKTIIKSDICVWLKTLGKKYKTPIGLIYLLGMFPEYRNLFYHRIGNSKYFLNLFCHKMQALNIDGYVKIGEGFFINHGFATAIGAKSIGKNCRVNQQVTIGDHIGGKPIILDNVHIHSGAVIIGNVIIGNNSVIGANATVFKDVPDNCTVFPAQSLYMKWSKKVDTTVKGIENRAEH